MTSTTDCPTRETLELFIRGRLSPEEVEAKAAHVEACPDCIAQLKTMLASDTLEHALRAQALGNTPQIPECLLGIMDAIPALELLRASTLNLDKAAAEQALRYLGPPQRPGELGRLGTYRILRILGKGGMGTVFEAEDTTLHRRVALKVMKPAIAASPSARERFQREARLMAALKHDHIVTIFQVGEDAGTPFLAMELLHGETLEDRLAAGVLPLAEVLRIGTQIALGLEAAHKHGLIHRDIKPANIWLETRSPAPAAADKGQDATKPPHSGAGQETVRNQVAAPPPDPPAPEEPPSYQAARVKILDFGLARPAKEEGTLTGSGVVVGTPSYMAPEQAQGEPVNSLSDLYGLGCILYRMCTGRLPVPGKDIMAVLANLAVAEPKPPRAYNPEVPPALDSLIMQLLAKNAADRPPTARVVITALRALANPARTTSPPPALRQRRLLWAGVALVFLALVGYFRGPTVLRFLKNEGQLVVETGAQAVEVTVSRGAEVPPVAYDLDKNARQSVVVEAGPMEVKVVAKDGARFGTRKLTLARGGTEVLKADPVMNQTKPRVLTLKVPANQFWTATDIDLVAGMVLEISATGKVDASMEETKRPYFLQVPPEGREERVAQVPQPQLPGLCLLGKIAPAQVFYVGAKLRLPIDATKEGAFFLGINDDIVDDNSGAWDVRIVIHAPPITGGP